MTEIRRYLAAIGRRGGIKSRRVLDPEKAREMVRAREVRRAKRIRAPHERIDLARSADTTAHAAAVQDAILRKLSAARKLALVASLSRTVDALAREGVKHRHPDADAGEVDRHCAELRLGAALAGRAYGPHGPR